MALLLVAGVAGRKRDEDLSWDVYFLKNLVPILGGSVLGCVFIWCVYSVFAGRAEKKEQEKRRRRREEQE